MSEVLVANPRDADKIPGNIRKNIVIDGVTGVYEGGIPGQQGVAFTDLIVFYDITQYKYVRETSTAIYFIYIASGRVKANGYGGAKVTSIKYDKSTGNITTQISATSNISSTAHYPVFTSGGYENGNYLVFNGSYLYGDRGRCILDTTTDVWTIENSNDTTGTNFTTTSIYYQGNTLTPTTVNGDNYSGDGYGILCYITIS